MQKLALIIFLVAGTNAFGQAAPKTAKSPIEFVPAGYVVSEKIQGDLNKDNQADYVFIIKETKRANFVKNKFDDEVDRNRRGILIAFKNENQYELVLENRDCFSSENEDGGVYIEKGNLRVHYFHGRYGFTAYKFRYQNSDFELIGYDSSQNRGPVTEKSVSINLMTKRMLIKENINQNAEAGGDEKFKETRKKFTLSNPIKLREIADFDGLEIPNMLGSVQ